MIQFRRIRYLVSLDKIDVSSISPRFVLSSVEFGERKRMRETREKRQRKRSKKRERDRESETEREREREADKTGSDLCPRTTL